MSRHVLLGDITPYRSENDTLRQAQYQRLFMQCERYFGTCLPAVHPPESITYMGIAIVNLALLYLVDGDGRHLNEARRWMRTVCGYPTWGNIDHVNVDLSASWVLFGLSLGYDWLKPFLNETERQWFFETIAGHARIIYDYKLQTAGAGWSTNYWQNHNWINMTGLAAAGYALRGEYAGAQAFIDEAKEDFATVFGCLAEDGSNYEGVSYWRYGGMWLFVYAYLLKQEEGIDYFAFSAYLQNTFDYRIHQAAPDMKRQLNFGDCHDRFSGHPACVYYLIARQYRNGYAQRLGNLVTGAFLKEEAAYSKIKPGILPEACFEFLWYDPAVPERDFHELPLVKFFPDLGLIAIRSGWDRNSTVFSFKCGCPGGQKQWREGWRLYKEKGMDCLSLSHHHPDNLSYILVKGDTYFTCEDGYNRAILPRHHSVLLADGQLTDAEGVNDVYMASIRKRLLEDPSLDPVSAYGGGIAYWGTRGSVTYACGESHRTYPSGLRMTRASRLVFTDGLQFILMISCLESDDPHIYQTVCNTDGEAQPLNAHTHAYATPSVRYTVLSDKPVVSERLKQQIVSVMTTQEPDKKTCVDMHTICHLSREKHRAQVFVECFSFEESPVVISFENGVIALQGAKRYEFVFPQRFSDYGIQSDAELTCLIRDDTGVEMIEMKPDSKEGRDAISE